MRAIARSADPADLNFIINSFLRSLRSYPALRHVPNELYYPEQKKVLEGFIMSGDLLVLCNSECPDQIFGYVIAQPDEETNFVYIKYPYRQMGFAKKLMEAIHPKLYEKTLLATYTCRNWEKVSTQFRHIHSPYKGV